MHQRPQGIHPQPRAGRMLGLGLLATVGVFAVAGLLWNAFAAQQLGGSGEPTYPQLVAVEPLFYGEARLPDAEQIDEELFQTDLLEEDEHERFRQYIEERPLDEHTEKLGKDGRRLVQSAVRLHNEELLPEHVTLTTVARDPDANPQHLEDVQLVGILTYEERQERDRANQILEREGVETLTVNYGDLSLLLIGREEASMRRVAQTLGEQEREMPERFAEAFELHSDEVGIFMVADTHKLWRSFLEEIAKQEPRYLEEISHRTRQRIHEVFTDLFPPEGLGNFAYFKGMENAEYRLPVESEVLDESHLMGEGGAELANYLPVNAGYISKLSLFKGPIEEDVEEPLFEHLKRLVPLIDEIGERLGEEMDVDHEVVQRHLRSMAQLSEGNFAFAVFPTFRPLPENRIGLTFVSHVTNGEEVYQRKLQAIEELGIADRFTNIQINERPATVLELEHVNANLITVYEDNVVVHLAVAGEMLEPRAVGQYLQAIEENSIAGRGALDQMIQQHNVSIDHTSLTGINLANMMEIKHQLRVLGVKMRLHRAGEMPEIPQQQGGGGGAIEPERVSIVTEEVDYENPLAQRWLANSVHFEDGLNGYANYGLREGFALMFLGDYLRHRHRTQAFEVLDQDRLRAVMQRFVEYKREQGETEPTQHWQCQLTLMVLDEQSQMALMALNPTRLERQRYEADEELGIPAKADEFEADMKEKREFTILIVDPRTNEPIAISVPVEDN